MTPHRVSTRSTTSDCRWIASDTSITSAPSPLESDEAAIMDEASWWTIFWRIMLPQSKPALATVAVLNIVAVWTDFFGPLIYLNDLKKMTLAVGLSFLRGQHTAALTLLMAGDMFSTLPILIIFFMAQRYFVEGIQLSGLKG